VPEPNRRRLEFGACPRFWRRQQCHEAGVTSTGRMDGRPAGWPSGDLVLGDPTPTGVRLAAPAHRLGRQLMPVCRHLIAGFLSISAAAFAENQGGLLQRAQQGSLLPRTIITPGGVKLTPGVSGGMLHGLELGASPRSNAAAVTSSRSTSAGPSNSAFLGLSRGTLGCGARNTDGNVRVNQDCGFRPQNETSIKVNPNDFDNLIGGMNDYRTGEGFQGFAFSID